MEDVQINREKYREAITLGNNGLETYEKSLKFWEKPNTVEIRSNTRYFKYSNIVKL